MRGLGRATIVTMLVVLLGGQTYFPLQDSEAGLKVCAVTHPHAGMLPTAPQEGGGSDEPSHPHQQQLCCHQTEYVPGFVMPLVPALRGVMLHPLPVPSYAQSLQVEPFYPVEVWPD